MAPQSQSSLLVRLLDAATLCCRSRLLTPRELDEIEELHTELTRNVIVPAPDGSHIIDAFHVLMAATLLEQVRDINARSYRVRTYRQLVGVMAPIVQDDLARLMMAQRNARPSTTEQSR